MDERDPVEKLEAMGMGDVSAKASRVSMMSRIERTMLRWIMVL